MDLPAAAVNLAAMARGGVADLRRMPRELVDDGPRGALYRYLPVPGVPQAGGEPVPGSVIAIAVMISPEQNPGSQRRFCSSVARRSR